MTNHSEEELEKALSNAKASMELSGFKITEEITHLVRTRLNREITEEEFLKVALEKAKAKE
ncbi:MAG: hypothetical protein AB2392_14180 [Neobacillus sp.]